MDGLNCPNCGAPLGIRDVCEYCGTHLMDCTMDTEKPFYIKIRHGDRLVVDRVMITNLTSRIEPDTTSLYADGIKMMTICNSIRHTYDIELESVGMNL